MFIDNNVNRRAGSFFNPVKVILMAEVKKRVRRTPEQARSLILDAAEVRLQSEGPEGLQVKEVAGIAGVAHSTVLHHFGSAEGLRRALMASMGNRLLADILAAVKKDTLQKGDNEILLSVFETLSDKGHARLLAWMMLKGDQPASDNDQMQQLFHQLIEEIAAISVADRGDKSARGWRLARQQARFTTMLAAVAAVGDGIAGAFLAGQIGLTDSEARGEFRDWFGALLNSQTDEPLCK